MSNDIYIYIYIYIGFEGTLEPYMVISENFIYVPGWDERTPPNKKKIKK